jgi:acetoin utilization protein AcuB
MRIESKEGPMKTSEIVKHQIVATAPNLIVTDLQTSAEEALSVMEKFKIHHLVVLEDETLVGIVSDRDILLHAMRLGGIRHASGLTVAQTLRRDLPSVREATEVHEVLKMMQDAQSDALPILREKKIMGIVTEKDMIRTLEHLLHKSQIDKNVPPDDPSALFNPFSQQIVMMLAEIGI